jgi:hypothetical protein
MTRTALAALVDELLREAIVVITDGSQKLSRQKIGISS